MGFLSERFGVVRDEVSSNHLFPWETPSLVCVDVHPSILGLRGELRFHSEPHWRLQIVLEGHGWGVLLAGISEKFLLLLSQSTYE